MDRISQPLDMAQFHLILIEPGCTFQLRVRLFPNFHSSVVSYNGELYIPHQFCPASLIMIGKNSNGHPHYFKFPPKTINDLEPVGDLKTFIVVGIKERKIQVIPSYYTEHLTTSTLSLVDFPDLLNEARNNPVRAKPRPMFKYLVGSHQWHMFYGWKNAHKWLNGSDWCCRRIHVFYRAIREETSAARARYFTLRE
jgi:hypothetical protein